VVVLVAKIPRRSSLARLCQECADSECGTSWEMSTPS